MRFSALSKSGSTFAALVLRRAQRSFVINAALRPRQILRVRARANIRTSVVTGKPYSSQDWMPTKAGRTRSNPLLQCRGNAHGGLPVVCLTDQYKTLFADRLSVAQSEQIVPYCLRMIVLCSQSNVAIRSYEPQATSIIGRPQRGLEYVGKLAHNGCKGSVLRSKQGKARRRSFAYSWLTIMNGSPLSGRRSSVLKITGPVERTVRISDRDLRNCIRHRVPHRHQSEYQSSNVIANGLLCLSFYQRHRGCSTCLLKNQLGNGAPLRAVAREQGFGSTQPPRGQ
jgi:hypothetical protein